MAIVNRSKTTGRLARHRIKRRAQRQRNRHLIHLNPLDNADSLQLDNSTKRSSQNNLWTLDTAELHTFPQPQNSSRIQSIAATGRDCHSVYSAASSAKEEKEAHLCLSLMELEPLPSISNEPTNPTYMLYSSNATTVYANFLSELHPLTSGCFWLDIANPTDEELHAIAELFDIHPLTIEDVQFGCPRDKIDQFDSYTSVVYHSISSHDAITEQTYTSTPSNQLQTCQHVVVMKANLVLTFHSDKHRHISLQVLNRLASIRNAIIETDDGKPNKLECLLEYPPYIVYAILDQITDELSPFILSLERQVDRLDELVLHLSYQNNNGEEEEVLQQMGEQRRYILTLTRLVQGKPAIVTQLTQKLQVDNPTAKTEVRKYFLDIKTHLLTAVSSLTHSEEILSRTHSNYLAKISLQLARASLDSNSTVERWTMLGIIVIPINIVASLLGVNIKVPGQDFDNTNCFFIVVACMLFYATVTLVFWKRRELK